MDSNATPDQARLKRLENLLRDLALVVLDIDRAVYKCIKTINYNAARKDSPPIPLEALKTLEAHGGVCKQIISLLSDDELQF